MFTHFKNKLKNFTASEGKFTALCPAHDDKHPSLSGYINAHGNITLKCFAGCNIDDILKKIGMTKKDLILNNKVDIPKKKIVETYNYTDDTGKVLYQSCRYEPKRFVQRRPDNNNWIYNLKGIKKVIYRLPEIIDAIKNNETIFIAEGEKDVHNLVKLGYQATTNSGGALHWNESFNQIFINSDVVIFHDNDEVGIKHANNILNGLKSIAKSVRIIDIYEKDISEWIEKREKNNKTHPEIKVELDKLIYQVKSEKDYSTYTDLKGKLNEITWKWEHWLPDGFVTLLVGNSGIGKSLLALKIASSFVTGCKFPDGSDYNGNTGCVLLCDTESSQQLWLSRIEQMNLPTDKFIPPFKDGFTDLNLDIIEHRERLQTLAQMEEIKLVLIDSLSGSSNSDENKVETAEKLKFLSILARDTGKPIIVVHHLNKNSSNNSKIQLNNVRGSSAIVQFARVIWAIDIPNISDENHKRLSILKSNFYNQVKPIGLCFNEKDIIFNDAPTEPKVITQKNSATEFLLNYLKNGKKLQKDIIDSAQKIGLTEITLKRAKKELAIQSKKEKEQW